VCAGGAALFSNMSNRETIAAILRAATVAGKALDGGSSSAVEAAMRGLRETIKSTGVMQKLFGIEVERAQLEALMAGRPPLGKLSERVRCLALAARTRA